MMKQLNDIKTQIRSALHGGDILLIVPPFVCVQSPALGVHILQTIAEEQGYRAEILYLNLLLASLIGVERSEQIILPPPDSYWSMINERLFARSAYGLPPLGRSPEACFDETRSTGETHLPPPSLPKREDREMSSLQELEEICYAFVEEAVEAIAAFGYSLIGCTQMVGQTNCATALLHRLKTRRPETVTFTGGASCYRDMAQGIASLSGQIDYIFSGESESAFAHFLQQHAAGELPPERILDGAPFEDLDRLNLPDFRVFFEQMEDFLGEEKPQLTAVNYETSRGCWWGAEQACRFCNERHPFRHKSPPTILRDLRRIRDRHPGLPILSSDLNMPPSYHQELIPQIIEAGELPKMSFMTKADLSLTELIALKHAGIFRVTTGIEALSDGFLTLMNKGTTLARNLLFLRHARSIELHVDWLLLWGFPGDKRRFYQETLDLLPLICHLQPPVTFLHLLLVRFSSYLDRPQDFGISHLRPWAVYGMIYPEQADLDKLAYWYAGEYAAESREFPELIRTLAGEVAVWQERWRKTHLTLLPFQDYFLLLDNRGVRDKKQEVLDAEQARAIMTPGPYRASEFQEWAVTQKLAVVAEGEYVPLIAAAPELLENERN